MFIWAYNNRNMVAPHAGAWIETMKTSPRCKKNTVAPHAGAWIETRKAVL
jgi:hypothetical protein